MNKSVINLPLVLFIIFLVLKLTENINWAWTWVTSPLWIPIALMVGGFMFSLFILVVFLLFGLKMDKLIDFNDKLKSKLK